MNGSAPSLVLFDLDGVLVEYDRAVRLQHLADACGCTAEQARDVVFGSGLEDRYDAGELATAAYLDAVSRGLGAPVDAALWCEARGAAMRLDAGTPALVHAVARRADVAVLTNNGVLLAERLPVLLPPLFPLLAGRVLCSGGLRRRKPDPRVYVDAVAALGHAPAATLFLDDAPANVEGALGAGLRAGHVPRPRDLEAVLRHLGAL